MHKQRCFNGENVKLFYFSPYTDIFKLNNTKMLLKRHDTGRQVVISCSTENALQKIISSLSKGISENQLIEYMGSEKSFELCKTSGVIE